MESPAVDDDICILKHASAFVPLEAEAESPVSVCSGDESVASHFALVTAYEDIKKRLRDTEKENGLLRRRVKQLEDKHFRPEAPPSEGPQYMNRAFSAYRGIYIEKEDLQMELNRLKKEKQEVERMLTEQLQARELELLQLKSEMDTSQVMRSLTDAADLWPAERQQIRTLEDELERLRLENDALHALCRAAPDASVNCVRHNDTTSHDAQQDFRTLAVVQSYQSVLSEVCVLRSVVRSQAELMQKLKETPLPSAARRGGPVQCLEDVERVRPPSAPPVPCGSQDLSEDRPLSRAGPVFSPVSLDDSWSFPSAPPRPREPLVWSPSRSRPL